MEKTGPVNYRIQQQKDSRSYIIHVDKLYRYTQRPDESLASWLPELPVQLDVSCQCEDGIGQSTTECQTDAQPPSMAHSHTQTMTQSDLSSLSGPIDTSLTPTGPDNKNNSPATSLSRAPPADGQSTASLDPQKPVAGTSAAPLPPAHPPARRSRRERQRPVRYRLLQPADRDVTSCLAKAVLQLTRNYTQADMPPKQV